MDLFDELHPRITHLLQTQLPHFLTYHSPEHTAYVVEKATIISIKENVSKHDRLLIRIAALLHDIGFIKHYKNHEEAGCEISREILGEYYFDPAETNQICSMIMATKIPQSPSTLNERIVCDADLEYLGTELFEPISQSLYKEMHYINPDLELDAFNRLQVAFISNHSYHTAYCKTHLESRKWANLKALMASM